MLSRFQQNKTPNGKVAENRRRDLIVCIGSLSIALGFLLPWSGLLANGILFATFMPYLWIIPASIPFCLVFGRQRYKGNESSALRHSTRFVLALAFASVVYSVKFDEFMRVPPNVVSGLSLVVLGIIVSLVGTLSKRN